MRNQGWIYSKKIKSRKKLNPLIIQEWIKKMKRKVQNTFILLLKYLLAIKRNNYFNQIVQNLSPLCDIMKYLFFFEKQSFLFINSIIHKI